MKHRETHFRVGQYSVAPVTLKSGQYWTLRDTVVIPHKPKHRSTEQAFV